MKAYLIDPAVQEIKEIEYDGDYRTIAPTIGCDLFAIANFSENGDGVFVDDEGLFKDGQSFFHIQGYNQPLAGKGLVLGLNSADGESTSPKTTLEQLKERVHFYGHCANCGTGLYDLGANGEPLVEGRVCQPCDRFVLAYRLARLQEQGV